MTYAPTYQPSNQTLNTGYNSRFETIVEWIFNKSSFLASAGQLENHTVLNDTSFIRNESEIIYYLNSCGYTINKEQAQAITEFLLAEPEILFDLSIAFPIIKNYFEVSTLSLELYTDTEEDYSVLNVLIQHNYPFTIAFQKERSLFKNFFKSIYKKHLGKVNIKEVFVETALN